MPAMTGLTTRQAADLIGVSEHTIKGWLVRGLLPRFLPGRTQRILPADLSAARDAAHAGDLVPRWRADPTRAGQRLRALREAAGLNQQDLAARAGLTHEAISRLELGQKSAKAPTIMKLAQALSTDPERFVSDEPIGLQTLSTGEAGARLGVPPERLVRWIRDGVLPGTKLAGRWRIPAVAVAELERSGRLRGVSRRLDG
jgi:excisionase family DNA binding protein